jgi:hypothetical protein
MILLLPFVLIIVLLIAFYLQHEELRHQQKIVEELRKSPSGAQPVNTTQLIGIHNFTKDQSPSPQSPTPIHTPLPSAPLNTQVNFEVQYEKLLLEFKQSMNKASVDLEQNYQKAIEDSKLHHDKFMQSIEQNILSSQNQNLTEMSSKVNDVLLKFEQNLADFLSKAENQSLESINLELRSARQLIDTYKSQQFNIIDENIIAVLERTVSLVLKQKLTLKDQMDLVHEALEKAKLEKFFA